MPLPPTIPTSFVPNAGAPTPRRFKLDFIGAFSFVAYVIFAIVVVIALALFFYNRVLISQKSSQEAKLQEIRAGVDTATAEGFVRLRDRLNSSKALLANHIAVSNFFTKLEEVLPTTVHLASVHVSFADTKKVVLDGTGTARSFNSLAVASESFAKEDSQIRDAIFSHFVINKDKSVSFSLNATLDQKLVTFSALPPVVAPADADTDTASTTATSTPQL